MSDQWAYWHNALRGEFLEDLIQRGNPQSGFYRDRSKRAVAIWRDGDGNLRCTVTSGYQPTHADEIDELFGWVCRQPISRDLYMHVRDGGDWPEDVGAPVIGDNSDNRPLSEIIADQTEAKKAEMESWLEKIGGEITTEAHATKAANYAEWFQKQEKRADEARKAEKAPLDEQVADIQKRWTPIVDAAKGCKSWIKAKWEIWGRKELQRKREEEERRRQEALAELAETARLAEERGEQAPQLDLPAPQKARVSAGTRGKVAMKTRKVLKVSDARAMLLYWAQMEQPPQDLIDAAAKITEKVLKAGGGPIPGAALKDEEFAA